MNDPEQRGRMIIDCNLNLPLLYWASAQTGDDGFADAANRHLARAARLLVRSDASTYHTFYVDTVSGQPRHGSTHQGFSDDSSWARGQAWGIYGFAWGRGFRVKRAMPKSPGASPTISSTACPMTASVAGI
jgi:unsaturated chondroitin disaccharide hydrolase